MSKIYDLTTERLLVPCGIDTRFPRFAWKISSDEKGIAQISYRIILTCECGKTIWDSGTVISSRTVVKYTADALKPATKYVWSIISALSNGEVLEASSSFITGIGGTELFESAKWISYPQEKPEDEKICPSFRKEFTLDSSVDSVRVFTAGCGVYSAYINGERLSNLDADGNKCVYELTPGYTQVVDRKIYHSYDVTHLIKDGANCISAISTTGWWSDLIAGNLGKYPLFRAVVIINYKSGESFTLVTGEDWKVSAENPVVNASIYDGEVYDARISTQFMLAGFEDSEWKNAQISDEFKGVTESMRGVPTVCRDDLCRSAVKIYTYNSVKGATEEKHGTVDGVTEYPFPAFTLKRGETAVIDFGQNAAGREFISLSAKSGTVIKIRHTEMLNECDGLKSRGNDGPEGSLYIANMRAAKVTTTYTANGKGEESYRPLHTFYGFRYIDITATDDVTFYDIKGEVLTNVVYDSGNLKTGDNLINRLFENSRWGMYSNYVSVPTDCPQRDERYGWMADTQVYVTTAHYYSTAAAPFIEKWLQDVRDAQREDGAYPGVSPRGRYGNDMGKIGWADAGILAPYYLWRMTGDDTVIYDHYDSMKKYMDVYLEGTSCMGPAPLWGDWLSFEPNSRELQEYLGVCFYAWDALLMAKMASAIGNEGDALKYTKIYEREKGFFIEKYVNEDGSIAFSQQTAALYAIKLGLLPNKESVEKVTASLLENFERTGNRLQTGFLGTAILLPTLSDCGLNDIAYSLLVQDEMPSWLYSVKAGATTIWERWNSYSLKDGFGDVGMNSFNHYAYGAVSEWMFGYLAGIRPLTEGFSSFLLAPLPDKRMGFASASYESVAGLIRSEWKYDGDKIIYTCLVPANTTAMLVNPKNGEKTLLVSGEYNFEW